MLERRLSAKLGSRLQSELSADTDLRPWLTRARLTVYVVAVVVLLFAVLLVAAGVWLLVVGTGGPNILAVILGVIALGVAFLMRPRFGKVPHDDLVPADRSSGVHQLAGRVTAALETSPPQVIAVDGAWNASWATAGLGRTRVVTLGAPLFAVLPPEQRVALLAHELAHARNGDSRRGLLVGSAWSALAELYGVLAPDPDAEGWDLVMNPIFWVVSRPFYALLLVHARLTAHDAHRAEYLADELASRVAGTDAVVRLHETLLMDGLLAAGVVRTAQAGGDGSGLIARLAAQMREVPSRERERRRRVARLEETSLDAFHPPIASRIAVLEARAPVQATVHLSDDESAGLDAELAPFYPALEHELVEEYRDAVYYG